MTNLLIVYKKLQANNNETGQQSKVPCIYHSISIKPDQTRRIPTHIRGSYFW